MTRTAYLDLVGGLAGDMLLAALIDAGAPHAVLDDVVEALGLPDVKVEISTRDDHGLATTHVDVVETAPPPHRRALELIGLVESAQLSPTVAARSLDALDRLIRAESSIHDVPVEDLILHEVGGADTLVDVVGTFALLDALGIDRIACSPVPYARGVVPTGHGVMPGPGPAVLEVLEGAMFVGVESDTELVTPTGAAIVAAATSEFGELPALRLDAVGYGSGSRRLHDRPNVLRVVLGTEVSSVARSDIVLLSATIDDLMPELVPDVVDACRAAGALDVWTVPVQMKKGRPGVDITAVARRDAEARVAHAMLVHATTLGVRVTSASRYELERIIVDVDVDGHRVRAKLALLDRRVVNVAPEHDDCANVAAATGRSVKAVWADALAAAVHFEGEKFDADPR
jgi:uncharacterized protein (TIGR00299 family) protein